MDVNERLLMALDKECEIYDELYTLSQKKQRDIIDGHIEKLELATKREQTLIASLMKLEDIRDSLISDIAKKHRLNKIETLDDIMTCIPLKYQSSIRDVRKRLFGVMSNVKKVNTENGSLIEQSLDIIEFNMNLMTNFGDTESSYSGKANIKYDNGTRNMFDVKV